MNDSTNSSDEFDEFLEAPAPSDSELAKIRDLSERQLRIERELLDLEAALAAKKKELQEVAEHLLPEAMDSAGLTEFTNLNGDKIKVDDVIRCHISKDRQEDAYQWLRNNDAGELIKNEVSVVFGRGQDDAANEVAVQLIKEGYDPIVKSTVNWQTLNAWAKEQVRAGANLPADTLGLYVGRITKVKLNKKGTVL